MAIGTIAVVLVAVIGSADVPAGGARDPRRRRQPAAASPILGRRPRTEGSGRVGGWLVRARRWRRSGHRRPAVTRGDPAGDRRVARSLAAPPADRPTSLVPRLARRRPASTCSTRSGRRAPTLELAGRRHPRGRGPQRRPRSSGSPDAAARDRRARGPDRDRRPRRTGRSRWSRYDGRRPATTSANRDDRPPGPARGRARRRSAAARASEALVTGDAAYTLDVVDFYADGMPLVIGVRARRCRSCCCSSPSARSSSRSRRSC